VLIYVVLFVVEVYMYLAFLMAVKSLWSFLWMEGWVMARFWMPLKSSIRSEITYLILSELMYICLPRLTYGPSIN